MIDTLLTVLDMLQPDAVEVGELAADHGDRRDDVARRGRNPGMRHTFFAIEGRQGRGPDELDDGHGHHQPRAGSANVRGSRRDAPDRTRGACRSLRDDQRAGKLVRTNTTVESILKNGFYMEL